MTEHHDNAARQRTLLIILDGYGINASSVNNGIANARTPRLDDYFQRYPHTQLNASGLAVGLPEGQMGNSEVGHLTLGSGAIMRQYLVHIDAAIADESFYQNSALNRAVQHAKQQQRPLHLIALVSQGGVHSHLRHVLAMIELCGQHGVTPLLHMITDGRDTPPHSALNDLDLLLTVLHDNGGAIATISGRFYAMDRDQRWERTEQAWCAMARNTGLHAATPRTALETAYDRGESDEFIAPTVLPDATPMIAGDAAVFCNFRADRARQLTRALASPQFDGFDRDGFAPLDTTCMTEYDPALALPYAFTQERPHTTLAATLANHGVRQFHCAETEKYAHVTYFFNGGRHEPHPDEQWRTIPSPKVNTYDQAPAMSAAEVADEVIDAIKSREHEFLVVNFANGDMVGHTAIFDAVVQAVETLDTEVGRLLDAAVEEGYAAVVTADHGNCELLVDPETGKPHTQHTTYPVPCLIVDRRRWRLANGGGLRDIAPTVLQLMGLDKPAAMSGQSLLLERIGSASDQAA